MHKVRVAVKARSGGDYFTVKEPYVPVLRMEGETLVEVQSDISRQKYSSVIGMPKQIAALYHNVFRNSAFLQSVHFSHTPYQLASGVFAGCTELESVTLAEGTEKIPMGTFLDCHKLKKVVLPDSVKRINMEAFKNCRTLKEVKLPQALEAIEMDAFWGCRALERIVLPENVTEVDDSAFASCTGLKEVRLPESLQSVGFGAFMNCISLEEIVIPSGITDLPLNAFAGCRNLRRVVLPDTLESMHPYAFYKCDKLEEVVYPAAEKFLEALSDTPFWRKRHPDASAQPKVPMELLNKVAGEVSGLMLSAMGYHWFDPGREYRIFLTKEPGVIEVRTRYENIHRAGEYLNDYWLMDERLEPIPGTVPLLGRTDAEAFRDREAWLQQAAKNIC